MTSSLTFEGHRRVGRRVSEFDIAPADVGEYIREHIADGYGTLDALDEADEADVEGGVMLTATVRRRRRRRGHSSRAAIKAKQAENAMRTLGSFFYRVVPREIARKKKHHPEFELSRTTLVSGDYDPRSGAFTALYKTATDGGGFVLVRFFITATGEKTGEKISLKSVTRLRRDDVESGWNRWLVVDSKKMLNRARMAAAVVATTAAARATTRATTRAL